MKNPVLQTHHLDIGYKQARRAAKVVVSDIDVTLHAGELACLIGPNGAGKSTLMRTLAGMQPALAGEVDLLGDAVGSLNPREMARRLGIVLTERQDVGKLTAYELVALGRYPHTDWTGRLSEDDERAIQSAIEAVGAVDLAARQVSELSDGERQKVMIARALAQEPAVILLDEPTAYLDLPRRVEIMATLRTLAHQTGRAILLSTHDLDLALRTADTLWLLPKGRPLMVGAPEDLVLNGALAAAFRSEGVEFDLQTGSFRMVTHQVGEIGLIGEGVTAIWTARALERLGFRVVMNPTDEMKQIKITSDGQHWVYCSDGESQIVDSIQALVQLLKNTNTAL